MKKTLLRILNVTLIVLLLGGNIYQIIGGVLRYVSLPLLWGRKVKCKQ